MVLAIYSRQLKEKDQPYLQMLLQVIEEYGLYCMFYESYLIQLKENNYVTKSYDSYSSLEDLKAAKTDVIITLGGDGTILDTLTLVKNSEIPVMGVNLGRLGFLASTAKEYIKEAIESIVMGSFIVEKRSVLQLESEIDIFDGNCFALNDFTILKRDTSSMIVVHAYINGEFLNSYWADGLIVATPTGSTGYSLSCGGPIIFPNSGNLVITPVAPHNLNVRPIVIPDNSVVSFEIETRSDNFLCTLDARFKAIGVENQLAIRKADFQFMLIRMPEANFLSTLRTKLAWGLDSRN